MLSKNYLLIPKKKDLKLAACIKPLCFFIRPFLISDPKKMQHQKVMHTTLKEVNEKAQKAYY
ncbi:hypothetical protein JM83_2927 [Gillisia sp. Hel_I_86]|nr:hypothetical protein JM83_2927 [Gillisia sp. Hel_I_86]